MPVPVPAVMHLLSERQAPSNRLHQDTGELTTPTGAALVCELAESFSHSTGTTVAVGYGAGHKDIPGRLNVCRAWLLTAKPRSRRSR